MTDHMKCVFVVTFLLHKIWIINQRANKYQECRMTYTIKKIIIIISWIVTVTMWSKLCIYNFYYSLDLEILKINLLQITFYITFLKKTFKLILN